MYYGELSVASASESGLIRMWDGFLCKDKQDAYIEQLSDQFVTNHKLEIAVLSWNIDSRKPVDLEVSDMAERSFLVDELRKHPNTDIFVVGFQELVDLDLVTSSLK